MVTAESPVQVSRINSLKDDIFQRKGSFVPTYNPFTRDVALWRVTRNPLSRVQTRAALLHELVKLAEIEIRPCWSLAGQHLILSPDQPLFGFDSPNYKASLDRILELGVNMDEVENIRQTVQNWSKSPFSTQNEKGYFSNWFETGYPQSSNQGYTLGGWVVTSDVVYWASGWVENHSIRDYAKVLRIGFKGIRKQIESLLESSDITDKDFPQKENFWKAALSICDAGILLGRRYSDLALNLSQQVDDPEERIRLQNIAETCSRVPAEGARTLHEAVQSLWLAHILTCGEDHINANSIGRLDQILFPYYQADIQSGRLTREQALDLMEELACKLYLEYDVQAIILGGVDREGKNAINELSHIILDATREVHFVRDVSIRLDEDTPYSFIRHAASLIARGGGIPFIFNDDCFIPALHDHGISLEDARDYAPIGCIELTVPGRANPHAVSGWFNSTKCLELALFDGKDPRSNNQLGPQTGMLTDLKNYEDLYSAYCKQVEFFARGMVYHCNYGELAQREAGPLPYLSVLTDDCIQRGRDITNGGPVYNYHSICFLGNANTADSLIAIKKLVFEEKKIAPADLLDALKANFQGHEDLRQMLLNKAPKYGNDIVEVDLIAEQVAMQFIDLMDQMHSPLGGRYHVHLFTFRVNIDFGKAVGATPDGRHSEEPLAYSLSAMQGRDQSGVAALLNSLSRMPHKHAAGASAAIIEITPVMVQGEQGVDRLAQIIQSAIQMGVGQMQWNVTTVEQLKKAQEDPEHYGNLEVRVAGYSQKFRLIPKELQDHIIARTKHNQ